MRRFLLLILLLFSVPAAVAAADLDSLNNEEDPVELEADQLEYDRQQGVYRATGDVSLKRGDLEVYGQSLQWNQNSGEMNADNGIRLLSPDQELSGSRARYNIQTGTGVIEQGDIFLRDENLHVSGETIERRGENEYHIENGTFTTCDGEVPSWKFGASELDVTLGGYARAKHMIFYLKDIPTLYFPYMIYPAKTERESGLLIPGVGYSKKRGFQYSGAYYQVLGVNQDATLFLDYLSEMGIGKGLEYRYVFGRTNAGEARLYHIDVDQVDGETIDEERYAVEWQHDGFLPGAVRMIADIEYVNDDDYFSDFGENAETYNKDQAISSFSLTRDWTRTSLSGLMKYTKDLEDDDDTTLQLLPRVTFDAVRTKIADSIFSYAFQGQYTHFWRREGVTGQRLMLLPTLSADVQVLQHFSLTPQLSYRERLYWDVNGGQDDEHAGLPEASLTLNTSFQKVYSGGSLGRHKLKHTVNPEIVYRYKPDEDQSHLPYFDSYDSIDEQNELEYALVQRLTLRTDVDGGGPRYRDLAYLRLSLDHDLSSDASGERLQDLSVETILKPFDWLTLDADAVFNIESETWDEGSVDLDIVSSSDRKIGLSYYYDRDDDLKYGTIDLSIDVLKPLYLHYQYRYDFISDGQLEQVASVEYRQSCWSALLSYRDHEDDQSLMLTFTMRGIGSVGGVGGSLGGI